MISKAVNDVQKFLSAAVMLIFPNAENFRVVFDALPLFSVFTVHRILRVRVSDGLGHDRVCPDGLPVQVRESLPGV